MSKEEAGTYAVVLTTAGSDEVAERIARGLVERRLAACVNCVPGVVSTYRWRGEVARDEERLLVVKTRASRLPAVEAAIRELHDYELPEVLVLPVSGGSRAYLDWLAGEVDP